MVMITFHRSVRGLPGCRADLRHDVVPPSGVGILAAQIELVREALAVEMQQTGRRFFDREGLTRKLALCQIQLPGACKRRLRRRLGGTADQSHDEREGDAQSIPSQPPFFFREGKLNT